MAQKFKERLLQGSGVSNKKVESEYAMKLMKMMGWSEGQGLGKNRDGQVDCVQVQRREEQAGLGKMPQLGKKQDDLWWEKSYSQSLKTLKPIVSQYEVHSAGEEEEEEGFSDYEKNRMKKKNLYPTKSVRVIPELSDSEEEDTFIAIQKKKIKKQ